MKEKLFLHDSEDYLFSLIPLSNGLLLENVFLPYFLKGIQFYKYSFLTWNTYSITVTLAAQPVLFLTNFSITDLFHLASYNLIHNIPIKWM